MPIAESNASVDAPPRSDESLRETFERLREQLKLTDEVAKAQAEEFKRRRTVLPAEQTRFWEHPPDPAPDRLCDWLLANHAARREESIERLV